MNWTTRTLAGALILGVSASTVISLHSTPAYSAAAVKLENKALAEAITGAQADAKANRWADALAKAKTADGFSGKPAGLTQQIHQMIIAYAVQAKDYNSALAMLDKMIAAKEGDTKKNLGQAVSIAFQAGNQQRAMGYVSELGTDLDPQTRLFIAQGFAKAKRYKEALDEVAPLRGAGQTQSESLLLFLQDLYNQMNDGANRRAILEQLVGAYPKPQYWHDLLQLARNERGLSDEQGLDIYRLRLALGDLKTDSDFSEMAQLALVAGYPGEAKAVLDAAAKAKVLAGERADRLIKMTNDRVGADGAAQADLQKKAAADANSSVKLGIVYWTYGKNKEAEDAIRNGLKGKIVPTKDNPEAAEAAKQALGHVLLSTGKKPEAVTTFNSVARNTKQANVSRLWSIYARQAPAPGEEKPAPKGGKRA